MATHKRSRTGCWTCREAGYKCDEAKPLCGRCVRLKITCKGYGVKLKWQENGFASLAKPPRKCRKKKAADYEEQAGTPSSLSASSYSPSIRLGASSDGMSSPGSTWDMPVVHLRGLQTMPNLSADDQWLLYYWTEHLSSLISVASEKGLATPFQAHLTSMMIECPALRSTVLSMAANHLAQASSDNSMCLQSYRHQRDAIHALQKMIQSPVDSTYEPALATVLMMQVSARLFGEGDDRTVANHLLGARAMITQYGNDREESTSTERFLLSLFAYHDILSSVSRGAQPLLNHGTSFAGVEGDENLKSIASVLLIVARTSELQSSIKARRAHSDNMALTEEEDATGRQIQQTLLAMDFEAPSNNESQQERDIRFTAQAYRHATFIYLYRTWLDIGAPNPISMDHIHRCLEGLACVDVDRPLTAAHIWPLFTAGCEAIDAAERQFVRNRFAEMYAVKRFPSLKRVMRDIEDVWAAKDMEQETKGQDGMARVDCIQVILRRRGREVDLA